MEKIRCKGRSKEGCAILSDIVLKCVREYGWKEISIVWVKRKLGIVNYSRSVYASVNMKTTK